MKNKRIGLCIQFEGVDNFGTVLQALATLKVVQDLGYEARLIRYKRKYTLQYIIEQLPRIFDYTTFKGYKRDSKRRKSLEKSEQFRNSMELKAVRFREYRDCFFDESLIDTYYGFEDLTLNSSNYDSILVGSDQLWLPAGLKTNFYNLQFVKDGINKISYATSFGVSTIPDNQKKATKDFLNRINYLSVRELAGAKIIKDLTGRDAYVACDPVMLYEKRCWEALIENVELPEELSEGNYVLTYFLGGSSTSREAALKVAQEFGMPLVPIKFVEDYFDIDETYGDISLFGLTPLQFVKLIQKASFVLTDSFHGTAFSIIFEKQFLSTYRFDNSDILSKNSRIDNVLGRLGLMDRLFTGEKEVTSLIRNTINYEQVTAYREEWRKESLNFLETALGGGGKC